MSPKPTNLPLPATLTPEQLEKGRELWDAFWRPEGPGQGKAILPEGFALGWAYAIGVQDALADQPAEPIAPEDQRPRQVVEYRQRYLVRRPGGFAGGLVEPLDEGSWYLVQDAPAEPPERQRVVESVAQALAVKTGRRWPTLPEEARDYLREEARVTLDVLEGRGFAITAPEPEADPEPVSDPGPDPVEWPYPVPTSPNIPQE